MTPQRTRAAYARVGVLVLLATVILTAAFVGILAGVTGEVGGLSDRLPWYVLVSATVFVAAIIGLEEGTVEGTVVLAAAAGGALTTLVVLLLATEGVNYAFTYPARVFNSDLVVYVLAAALLTTGLAYWLLQHWREYTGAGARTV
jgi:hypothetical protein